MPKRKRRRSCSASARSGLAPLPRVARAAASGEADVASPPPPPPPKALWWRRNARSRSSTVPLTKKVLMRTSFSCPTRWQRAALCASSPALRKGSRKKTVRAQVSVSPAAAAPAWSRSTEQSRVSRKALTACERSSTFATLDRMERWMIPWSSSTLLRYASAAGICEKMTAFSPRRSTSARRSSSTAVTLELSSVLPRTAASCERKCGSTESAGKRPLCTCRGGGGKCA
mmetsp:Transcript_26933/g.88381  ORF Transcript_26933/g.88381 Transcript_26933/m.88381 type:complete len:229 (+) Transcript_26933:117-803(+)